MYVANIILDIPLRQSYSYSCTEFLPCGSRVEVEFHGRHLIGFVVECMATSEFTAMSLAKLKAITRAYEDELAIPTQIWQMCEFTAAYYHHPLGNTIFCAIPALLRKTDTPAYAQITEDYYQIHNPAFIPKGRKQLQLWNQLQQRILSSKEIRKLLGHNPGQLLQRWLEKGNINKIAVAPGTPFGEIPDLNQEQQDVINKFSTYFGQFHVGLIYGITGSGKTEVFLHLISKTLQHQQQVLVLVPEINLTPQLADRFKNRFPYATISIINSEISDKERFGAWMAAKKGECHIILGTRLCVFTPALNLGLVIIDEEHDASFKQNESLRYHARDLAIWRARHLNIPVLLSSATPCLETLYNYKKGKYELYKLTHRARSNATLPKIELINLQHYPVNHAGITEPALDELAKCLERREMALIFINRRGYAPIITCYDCGWVSSCRYCSSKMVYHHDKKQLQCHHCSYHIQVPGACPQCHNQYLHTIGHGTQRLEQFIRERFPASGIKRVDRDTTNSKKAWHQLYHEIENEQIDILIGTQMLAKGHDFAKLTLVIGLNLDNSLYSYDFRAGEDMFSTLAQVAGRAGRADKPGRVLLQTNYPDHPVYDFLKKHDFNGFINYILDERRLNRLPPFSHYALVRLSDNNEHKLKTSLQKLRQLSREIPHKEVTIFPPVAAVIPKLHNKFRGQMLLMAMERQALHCYLQMLIPRLNALKVVTAIDVDPLEL